MFWINRIIFPTLHTGCITGKHLHQVITPTHVPKPHWSRSCSVLSSLLTYPSWRWFCFHGSLDYIWALHYMQIQACRTNTEQISMSYNIDMSQFTYVYIYIHIIIIQYHVSYLKHAVFKCGIECEWVNDLVSKDKPSCAPLRWTR